MHQNRSLNPNPKPVGPVAAVNRRFMRLLGEDGGPLTKIWGLIAVFNLGIAVLSAAIQIRTDAPMLHELFMNPEVMSQYGPDRPVETNLLTLLLYPLTLVMMALYYGSFNAVRAVESRPGRVNFSTAKSLMFERFVPTAVTTVVFMLAVGFGSACCLVPGLVAMFFLYFAPYLVSAHGMSPGKALGESINLAKRHGLMVALLVAISIVIAVGTMVIQFFSMAAFHGTFGTSGILMGTIATWVMGTIVGYFSWLYTGSVLVTVSKAEQLS